MKIRAYIADWNSPKTHAAQLYTQLERECPTVILESFHRPFAEQWQEAVDLFRAGDGDIFLWAMADVTVVRLPEMFRRMIELFERTDIAMYAPHIYYTSQRYKTRMLCEIDFGVYEVSGTDLLFCALTRELLDRLPPIGLNLRGWSYDYLMKFEATDQLGKKVVRDYNFIFGHPESSDYDKDQALDYYKRWLMQLSPAQQAGVKHYQEQQAYFCA